MVVSVAVCERECVFRQQSNIWTLLFNEIAEIQTQEMENEKRAEAEAVAATGGNPLVILLHTTRRRPRLYRFRSVTTASNEEFVNTEHMDDLVQQQQECHTSNKAVQKEGQIAEPWSPGVNLEKVLEQIRSKASGETGQDKEDKVKPVLL